MASGDTKTNQYLDIAANGSRADLPSDTCCETRTQTLIRGVAERIMDVEEEVEQLENNPDVVDIVDTYADLQGYDTSGLTDKDIIRVIADETKGGLSSYYRWNSPNPGWNFVGVIPGGDGIKELSSADYNYPTNNPDRVALWLLDNGVYTAPAGVMVAASTTSYPWYNTSDKTILVGGSDTVKGIYTFLNGKTDVVTTQVSDGTEADEYTLLKSTQVLQATGQSITDTMSQKAITDALASAGGAKELTTADYNWPTDNPIGVALWLLDPGMYYNETGVNVFTVSGTINNLERAYIVGKEVGNFTNIIQLTGDGAVLGTVNSTSGTRIYEYRTVTTGDVVSVPGNNQRNIMSQNATTSMVFADPSTRQKVQLGEYASASGGSSIAIGSLGNASYPTSSESAYAITIGAGAKVNTGSGYAVSIGTLASSSNVGAVALGAYSNATQQGQLDVGTSQSIYGYNNSQYRLLTGLYDPQSDHDAATKGYVDTAVASAGITELTSADYDYPDANPREVALWRLPGGLYKVNGSTVVAFNSSTQDVTPTDGATFLVLPNPDPNTPSRSRTLIIRQDLVEPTFYSVYRETGSNYSFGSLGVYVAQNTGTSADAVMSQNATTSMVFADPSTKYQVRIGGDATIIGHAVAIGGSSYARTNGVALGVSAKANDNGIAFAGCETNATGVMQVGPNRAGWDTSGYNNSAYRLISGVYDGQSNHDAATLAQGNKLMTTAPATTDAGVLGQLWTDTTAMHTYQLGSIDETDPSNPVYNWVQRW